jgi:dihydrofolate synthase/folylpolyglutamate synthase
MVPAMNGIIDDRTLEDWLSANLDRERTGGYRDCKLDGIRAVLAHLPRPPAPVTVAGTKGKGSTVRLLESILLAAGRRTVAFTSPHVVTVRERWRLDGRDVAISDLTPLVSRIEAAEAAAGRALSYFERTFALACLLAVDRPGADFICEVGIGGRLDCTNVLDARLAIITHLSHDHCHLLGDSIVAIAREKFAISRPGIPVLIGPQLPENHAAVAAAIPAGIAATWITVADATGLPPLRLPGGHQRGNAAVAAAAARLLMPGIGEEAIAAGVAAAVLPARCQLVEAGGRRLLIDGAHNGPSVAATLTVARELLRPGFTVCFGLARDKEIDRILPHLLALAGPIRRVGYAWPRSRGEAEWPAAARGWPWHDRIADALAASAASDVCVTGSFYLAGEAIAALATSGRVPPS